MEHTVTFRQGESAPFPVCFDCEAGMDPVPVVIDARGDHHPIRDGDQITFRGGAATHVNGQRLPAVVQPRPHGTLPRY